jgi:uncharacterized repeat protein (TIGR01451 family)
MVLAGGSSAARPASVSSQFRSAGIGLVKQIGLRNYAGPNCPGAAWSCTTSTRVLQVSSPGGQNLAECPGPGVVSSSPGNCVIDQSGAKNTARCTEKSTAVQYCEIKQSGGENYAFVTQSISQSDGATQYATQAAKVEQTGSITNQLQLSQDASQSTKIGSIQKQDVYQSAEVTQTATGTGTNVSSLYQSQLQKEYAKSTTQSQNSGVDVTPLADCVSGAPSKPNACAEVIQSAVNGKNENHLRQSINEDMNSAGPASQLQGSPDGGLEGHVHQDTAIGGPGSSTNEVKQSKALKEAVPKGPGSSQTQYDPISCCGFFSQEGGSGNSETINQSSSVSASNPGANQSVNVIGTSNTDGTCQVSQSASINNDSATNSANFTPCPFLTVETTCSGGSESSDCSAPTPVLGAPDSSLDLGVKNLSAEQLDYFDSIIAFSNQTLQYRAVYANSGTGSAHNVQVTIPIPPGLTYADSFCPQSSTLTQDQSGRFTALVCTLGPASDPGTVAPDTDALFSTATLDVTVDTTEACRHIGNTAAVQTAEEGTVPSDSTNVTVNPSNCVN